MGFRIDGCGTYTAVKKLKLVGQYTCKNCTCKRSFYICELTNKVSVLYIPIVKTSQARAAVLCSVCETGYQLTEEQKNAALSGDITFIDTLLGDRKTEVVEKEKSEDKPISSNEYEMDTQTTTETIKDGGCPRCGTPIDIEGSFCMTCGRKYLDKDKHRETEQCNLFCSNCGAKADKGMMFCTKCGKKLI